MILLLVPLFAGRHRLKGRWNFSLKPKISSYQGKTISDSTMCWRIILGHLSGGMARIEDHMVILRHAIREEMDTIPRIPRMAAGLDDRLVFSIHRPTLLCVVSSVLMKVGEKVMASAPYISEGRTAICQSARAAIRRSVDRQALAFRQAILKGMFCFSWAVCFEKDLPLPNTTPRYLYLSTS